MSGTRQKPDVKKTERKTPSRNWQVQIKRESKRHLKTNAQVTKILKKILSASDSEIGPENIRELSVVFTTDPKIRIINKEFRRKDKATDVLSFPQFEKEELRANEPTIGDSLGDLVISEDTTVAQARKFGVTVHEELVRLMVHGVLHLLGYDHEKVSAKEAQRMRRRERILRKIVLES